MSNIEKDEKRKHTFECLLHLLHVLHPLGLAVILSAYDLCFKKIKNSFELIEP